MLTNLYLVFMCLVLCFFLMFALACGLYFLSELIEEHSVLSRRILKGLIAFTITSLFLFWLLEGFPLMLVLFSVFSHLVYKSYFNGFPNVAAESYVVLSSAGLTVVSHLLWFIHFHNNFRSTGVAQIIAFFFGNVWLTPLLLFLSLSASESSLPFLSQETKAKYDDGKTPKQNLFKSVFSRIVGFSFKRSDL